MKRSYVVALALFVAGCSSAPRVSTPIEAPETNHTLYRLGQRLILERKLDSAEVILRKSIAVDPKYLPPREELAELYYVRGKSASGAGQTKKFKLAREEFSQIEKLGKRDANIYERLCELSLALHDAGGFLLFAKKSAAAYPYDRQFHNLALAYVNNNEYGDAIKVLKEAIEKFGSSSYVGSYYRQLGRSYMKVDRDQTAERSFYAGLEAIDRMVDSQTHDPAFRRSTEYIRLMEDRTGILTSLKGLHQTYRDVEKLRRVEQQLKDFR